MFVVPVHFAKEHKRMLTHTKGILEYKGGSIAINPRFEKKMPTSFAISDISILALDNSKHFIILKSVSLKSVAVRCKS
jgi:hypothetical protein